MSRTKFRSAPGNNYRKVICAKTGEEVTYRKSLAIDHKGDGRVLGKTKNDREITCAPACRRIKRKAITPIIPRDIKKSEAISKLLGGKKIVYSPKEVTKEEIAKMKGLLKKHGHTKMEVTPRSKM